MTEAKPANQPKRVGSAKARASQLDAEDAARLEWLEGLFKRNRGTWPLVAIQTIPSNAAVMAVNKHHGGEAGLVTRPTLRQAIDAARAQERERGGR